MKQILTASKALLGQTAYLSLFLLGIPILFFIFVFIPVKTIPGNDLAFQLSIFTRKDWFLMFLLSAATSLLLTMNFYIFRQRRALIQAGQTGIGGLSSVVGATMLIFVSLYFASKKVVRVCDECEESLRGCWG